MSRLLLTGNKNFYCSPTGDDNDDGESPGSAFRQPQKALDLLSASYDLGGKEVKIILEEGTYAGVRLSGLIPGIVSPDQLIITGNEDDPSSFLISVSGQTAVAVLFGASLRLDHIKVEVTGGNGDLFLADVGAYGKSNNVVCGAATARHFEVSHGATWECLPYSVAAAATRSHWCASHTGSMIKARTFVTILDEMEFTEAWAVAANGASMECPSCVFTNKSMVTGPRYRSVANAVIDSGGGGANYLPGTVAGFTDAGGLYR